MVKPTEPPAEPVAETASALSLRDASLFALRLALGRTPVETDVFSHVRKLGVLRRGAEALRRGRLLQMAAEDNAYVYARVSPTQRMVVALNTSDSPQPVTVNLAPLGPTPGARLEPRLGGAVVQTIDGPQLTLQLPPRSGLVWEWID